MISAAPAVLRIPVRRPGRGMLALALLPPLGLAALSVLLNRIALIDDGHTVAYADVRFIELLGMPPDTGRFVPLYHAFHWLLFQLFPKRAWVLSLGNAAYLTVAAWQVWRLSRRVGGAPFAGLAAVWLFTFNSATVESIFTLSKTEPKQAVLWLAALLMLLRVLDETRDRLTPFEAPVLFLLTGAALGFKETAVLLIVPLGVLLGVTALRARELPRAEPGRRIILAAAAMAPIAVSAGLSLAHGIAAGTYAREHVLSRALSANTFEVALVGSEPVLAGLLALGLLAGLGLIVFRADRRAPVVLVVLQLLAVAGLYTFLRAPHPYFYYLAGALAAALLGAAAFPAAGRRPAVTWIGAVLVTPLAVFGADRALAGASALGGWSWLYSRVTESVMRERPSRVLFHAPASAETHVQARAYWEHVLHLPLSTGVLDAAAGTTGPYSRAVKSRDLQPGDWILEQFGEPANAALPFRDLSMTRPVEYGLLSDGGGLVAVRLRHRFVAHFPSASDVLRLGPEPRTSLEWRILEVTARPRALLDGLTADRWMGDRAVVWVRLEGAERLKLAFWPFAPPGAGQDVVNEIHVAAGERTLARCPARAGRLNECLVRLGVLRGAESDGWVRLDLAAAQVYVPKALGVSDDPRAVSVNFTPTWQAGPGALLE